MRVAYWLKLQKGKSPNAVIIFLNVLYIPGLQAENERDFSIAGFSPSIAESRCWLNVLKKLSTSTPNYLMCRVFVSFNQSLVVIARMP